MRWPICCHIILWRFGQLIWILRKWLIWLIVCNTWLLRCLRFSSLIFPFVFINLSYYYIMIHWNYSLQHILSVEHPLNAHFALSNISRRTKSAKEVQGIVFNDLKFNASELKLLRHTVSECNPQSANSQSGCLAHCSQPSIFGRQYRAVLGCSLHDHFCTTWFWIVIKEFAYHATELSNKQFKLTKCFHLYRLFSPL